VDGSRAPDWRFEESCVQGHCVAVGRRMPEHGQVLMARPSLYGIYKQLAFIACFVLENIRASKAHILVP